MKKDPIIKEVIEALTEKKHVITVYETTDSTNLRLKEAAKNNAPSGSVIIAGNQTAGRGRLGRQFFSPSDSGIYMSLLVRPEKEMDIGLLTAYTAVVVCEALETVSSDKFGIKWVNDIIKNGKKVCGILAESGIDQGKLEYIIVGIGINVYQPENDFPDDIKNIAGSVFDKKIENGRNNIISQIINRFYAPEGDFVSKYKAKSTVIGKEINVHKPNSIQKAFAVDIDDNCNLVVCYENGETERLSFGEISIRPVQKAKNTF